jgi:hypothetical protein
MFTCGWCGRHYQVWNSKCAGCGGPMPAPPGMDAGPPPPPPPRKLPEGYATRVRFNFIFLAGLAFVLVGGMMTAFFISVKTWAALFPGFFFLGGLGMVKEGILHASRTLDAFRNGTGILGRITSVQLDRQTAVNDRSPWNIMYTFEVNGATHTGKVTTFESATMERLPEQRPVWVLAVEKRPERNTLYPPIR